MRQVLAGSAAAAAMLLTATVGARQTTPFTAEDMLKVASISVLDMTEDGTRLATTIRRPIDSASVDHRRYGDPTYLAPSRVAFEIVDARTGAKDTPFKDLVNVRDAAWSRDGRRLAILLAREAVQVEGFPITSLHLWDADRKTLTQVRPAQPIAVNSNLAWTPNGASLIVALRSPELDTEARRTFKALIEGPIVVHRSSEPFLEWDLLNRSARTRTVAVLDPATGSVRTVVPQGRISSYQVARDGSFMTIMEDVTAKTDYETIGGTDNTLKFVDIKSGESKLLLPAKELKGLSLRWSDDGRVFAYAKKGEIFVQGVDGSAARSLTPRPKTDPKASKEGAEPASGGTDTARAADEKKEPEENFSPVSFSRDGSKLLVTSRKGWYVVSLADASRKLIVPMDEDEEKNPRMSAIDWAPDGRSIYASWAARDRWERGIVSIDTAAGTMTPLVRDGRIYGSVRMIRDGGGFIATVTDGDRPAELYAADAKLASMKRLSDLNRWLSVKALPRSELVSYRDADGKQLYGVLRYPTGYEKGRRYPTVFELYETFFDNGFNSRAAFLANHGYAVFHPSVNLVVGRPGEAWVKGVTSAANRLIDMGIADPDRLGVHGTSYGGYATALLITQTDRFKAAINISGKVNMVSFYTDSPRLGVRNTHAPEKSQDRVGGTLWEFPERYLEHSAVMRADRVKTPLLNITGDQDPNVPASQSREMYYAMRRLGKEVEWVRYVNGGHRPPNSPDESIDFEQRILAWYDKYLKADKKKSSTN
ncbi:MAG TPA: prolyl oligopeptidase family serine peptidase [Vicinamibacterales bacterium]|nr:prolyl oligopeptidase family serine peptidase [Vicinamibacterales bacterium]